ncbi:glycosyltransferase family A protein [Gaetbulibacter sp. NE]|uniref:glycosyltransferase family A protein n=1 Tax=Gaetbulibacter sp. NE TaxID=2982307 RepID=UPI0021CF4768|nr:glycosyltransferase family A protein [Gaetbulibacter sp. NE]
MSRVSVIIPTYNNPKQLERAVVSVFAQSYTDIEVIVVDDGSTEDYTVTISKLKEESQFPFYYYKKTNEGPGVARQYGLDKASGVFFQYLDSDDELLPDKLERQVAILESHPDIVMTYGLSMLNHDRSKIHRGKHIRNVESDLLQEVLEVRKWHTSACLWHYPKGQYWESLFNGEDVLHDFNVGIASRGRILFANTIVTTIHTYDGHQRLSNASGHNKNHSRLIGNFTQMNVLMCERLLEAGLLKQSCYANPLAERMFHAAMRVNLLGDEAASIELVSLAQKTAISKVKRVELLLLKGLIRLPLKRRRKVYQRFYDIRRRLHSATVHQYRYI